MTTTLRVILLFLLAPLLGVVASAFSVPQGDLGIVVPQVTYELAPANALEAGICSYDDTGALLHQRSSLNDKDSAEPAQNQLHFRPTPEAHMPLSAFWDYLVAAKGADDFVTVFRGDRPGTNVIKSKAAMEGGYRHSQDLIDNGNLDSLFSQHAISSDIPASPFISVTTDRRVAEFFAGPNGVVNEFRIPSNRIHFNPHNNMLVPAGTNGSMIREAEWLVPNYIRPSEFVNP